LVETTYIQIIGQNKTPELELTGKSFDLVDLNDFSKQHFGKKARIGCYVAYAETLTGQVHLYQGEIKGKVGNKVEGGSGWDTIVYLPSLNKTLGELKEYKHIVNFRRDPYLKFSLEHMND